MSVHYTKKIAKVARSFNTQHAERTIKPTTGKLADFIDESIMLKLEARRSDVEKRHHDIYVLVTFTFEEQPTYRRRSPGVVNDALKHAHAIAEKGGDDYNRLLSTLKFAYNSRQAYIDACNAVGIDA